MTAQWSTEHEALACAVAHAVGVDRPREPAAAPDWDAVVALARRHFVLPLVHHSPWPRAAGAPPAVLDELERDAWASARASLRSLELHRDLLAELDAGGIDALVLKGLPLAQTVYGSITARAAGDLDLLVRPAQVSAAATALERVGLRAHRGDAGIDAEPGAVLAAPLRYPAVKHAHFEGGDVPAELHWRLMKNPRLLPLDERWLAEPAIVATGGVPMPVLSPQIGWRHVHVHGAEHDWVNLKSLADVPGFARRHPEVVSGQALERVARDGLARPVAAGMLLADDVLGGGLPEAALAWARGVRGAGSIAARGRRGLALPEQPMRGLSAPYLAGLARARLGLRADAGYKRAELRNLLLLAGRAEGTPDPGARELLGAPVTWARRRVGRRLA